MRTFLLFLVLLLFSRLRLGAEMITDFLVASNENSITSSDTASYADITSSSFADGDPIDAHLELDLLSMSFDRTRSLERDPRGPAVDRLIKIPEAVRSIPETPTFLLVVTGVFGMLAVPSKNHFAGQS